MDIHLSGIPAGRDVFYSLNSVFDCGENEVGMLFLQKGALFLDLDVGRADGAADGVDAPDAGLITWREQNQSIALSADATNVFGAGDLL